MPTMPIIFREPPFPDLVEHLASDRLINLTGDGTAQERVLERTRSNAMMRRLRVQPPAVAVYACKRCGCTEDTPCEDGCSWVGERLCSACETPAERSLRPDKIEARLAKAAAEQTAREQRAAHRRQLRLERIQQHADYLKSRKGRHTR